MPNQLNMLLGYSVFAVTQAVPELPLALPRTEADIIASTLPEPIANSVPSSQSQRSETKPSTHTTKPAEQHEGFEDEDYELQAALQASLMHSEPASAPPPADSPSFASTRSHIWPTPSASSSMEPERRSGSYTPEPPNPRVSTVPLPGHVDVDPVTASMERNRVLLQRMKEQQEFAQREMWLESDLTPDEQMALNERRERRRREEEDEANELRRAIEESEALANQRIHNVHTDDTTMHEISGKEEIHYDDDDAELQAALKASLEAVNQPVSQSSSTNDVDSISSDTASTDVAVEVEVPSLEEVRKRRLARFGL